MENWTTAAALVTYPVFYSGRTVVVRGDLRRQDLQGDRAVVAWMSGDARASQDGDGSGIYAHAPALHEYTLNSQWKTITGRYGLQDGNRGRVDFEIVGDGRLLWNQRGVGAGQGGVFEVDVTGVQSLSLRVGDGGNGTSSDWGVWMEPTLVR